MVNSKKKEWLIKKKEEEEEEPPEEDALFCLVGEIEFICFESQADCQAVLDLSGLEEAECRGFETLPEGARLCTFEEPNTITCPF
jgi:hypothetical protein